MLNDEGIFRFYRSFFSRFFSFVFLSAGPAWLFGFEGRQWGQVDLLFRRRSDQKLVGVYKIFADFNVSLVNQDSCLVD